VRDPFTDMQSPMQGKDRLPFLATAILLVAPGCMSGAKEDLQPVPPQQVQASEDDAGGAPADRSIQIHDMLEGERERLFEEGLVVGDRGAKRLIMAGFEGVAPRNAVLRNMFDKTHFEFAGRIVQRRDGDEGFGVSGSYQYPFMNTDDVGTSDGQFLADISGRVLASIFQRDTDGEGYFSGVLGAKYAGLLLPEATREGTRANYDDLFEALNGSETIEDLESDPRWRDYRDHLQQSVGSFIYTESGLFAGMETSESVDQRQWVGGLTVYWEPFGYGSSNANFLDWLGAAIRRLAQYDDEWTPRFLPTFRYNMAYVMPETETPREKVGDRTDYWRGELEVGYQTPVAINGDKRYFIDVEWLLYHELDASPLVKEAGLDVYDLLSLRLRSSEGLYFAYRTGHMPFDPVDRDTMEFGWIVHF